MDRGNFMLIRELRNKMNLSQREFSDRFGIPISTLRKWEQGESRPSKYLINLLLKCEPEFNKQYVAVGDEKNRYYFNKEANIIYDKYGNGIHISEDLSKVKRSNLIIYLNEFFNSFYSLQDNLNLSIKYDSINNITWSVDHE